VVEEEPAMGRQGDDMSRGASPVALVGTRALDRHDTGDGHPERHERLAAITTGIELAGLRDAVCELAPAEASDEELQGVHTPGYLAAIERFVAAGGRNLDPDTVTSAGSWRTARLAAGSGLVAIEAVRAGQADSGFVAVRPPGHHATSNRAMGFCLLNNVAIGAPWLAARGERVAIVDWDVHHGNGTEQIFWNEPNVLYVSTHEWPAYPGTGRASDVGGTGAVGATVNVPLPPGATGDAARAAFDEIVAPAMEQFAPTWVLLSAGFDAHRDDPLADLRWSAGDYADLTRRVRRFVPASGGLVAYLEGGYDLAALARSSGATLAALAGENWDGEPPSSGGPGLDEVRIAARLRARAIEEATA
jgi:acetoin utilization deacetylase AcuC-like enzyme